MSSNSSAGFLTFVLVFSATTFIPECCAPDVLNTFPKCAQTSPPSGLPDKPVLQTPDQPPKSLQGTVTALNGGPAPLSWFLDSFKNISTMIYITGLQNMLATTKK